MVRLTAELFEAAGGDDVQRNSLAVGQPLNLLSELGRKAVSTVEFTDWPARGGEHFEDGVAFKTEVSEITDNSENQSYYTSAGSYRLVRMGIEAIF